MRKAPDEKAAVPDASGTKPQWQPPASATRTLPAALVVPPAAGVAAPVAPPAPTAPAISGSRPADAARADAQVGLEHTLQAGANGPEPPRPFAVGEIIADRYVVEQHISSGG